MSLYDCKILFAFFWCIHICTVPHLPSTPYSLSTLFSLALSILSCSHITIGTLMNRLGLLDNQRTGIFPFSVELSLLNQKMRASSLHPVLLCAFIMKDLGLWGDCVCEEESWRVQISGSIREGRGRLRPFLSHGSVHLLIPL